MASGDITAIKVLYRHPWGGGFDDLGNRVNNKILVVGEVTCTYVAAGIAVNGVGGVNAFGVTKLDFLKLEMVTSNAVYSDNRALMIASYDHVNQKIFVVIDEGAASPIVPTDGHAVVFRFLALGDDAGAPVLT